MIQALFPTEQQATILLHNDPGSGECCSLVMPHKSAGTRPSGYPYSFGEGKSATGQQHPEQDHRLGIFSMAAEMGRDLISQRARKALRFKKEQVLRPVGSKGLARASRRGSPRNVTTQQKRISTRAQEAWDEDGQSHTSTRQY